MNFIGLYVQNTSDYGRFYEFLNVLNLVLYFLILVEVPLKDIGKMANGMD